MAPISVIFTCKRRPYITELCLRRFLEVMSYPFEIILVYHGRNMEYVDNLLEIYDFEHIIMNLEGRKTRFALINDGLDSARYNHFMHMENDYYWSKPGALENSFLAFDCIPDLEFIRFEYVPFTEEDFKRVVKLDGDSIGIYKEDRPRFQFTFNPHIRTEKFPIGRFIESPIEGKQPEGVFADMYREMNRVAGCLLGDNFRHIGVYAEGGYYKPYYTNRFTLRRDHISKELYTSFKPMEEFKKFCHNRYYIELFQKHLDSKGMMGHG